jgi:hypothetical protein
MAAVGRAAVAGDALVGAPTLTLPEQVAAGYPPTH